MEIPSPNPQSQSIPTSPEFEFWMVRNPSFPQPNLLSADELFVDGVLLPLHLLSNPDPPPSDPDPIDGPKLTEQDRSLTSSKRWSIFKKSEKKNPSINQKNQKNKKKTGNGSASAELNINLWPFSRSRSAGNSFSRPKMFPAAQPGSRKVNSAPCSRSNSAGESKSRKCPTSPTRPGVHLGRSSPVWHVRRGGSADKPTAAPAAAPASRVRVLNLNVPLCIGYRNHLSCRSDETSALPVAGGGVDGGAGNLFSIRSLFTKKVH